MIAKKSANKKTDNGFTIVELLIVIVVIGILATISIVTYSGVQNRARDSKAAINANTTQKAAEAYFADFSAYPTTTAMFSSSIITLPSGITLLKAASASALPSSPALNSASGENSILYRYVLTSGVATGACIFFWDFSPATGSARISDGTFIGTATSANCSATVGGTGNSLTS